MRLTRVLIENFRGIGQLDLEFDSITAVIGENNSGKTSLFDVLGLFLGRGNLVKDRLLRVDDLHLPHGRSKPLPVRVVFTFEDTGAESWAGAEPPAFVSAIRRGSDGIGQLRLEFVGDPETRFITGGFRDEDGIRVAPASPGGVEALCRMHPVLLLRFAQPSTTTPEDLAASDAASPPEKRGRRGLEAQIARVYRELSMSRGPVEPDALVGGLQAARDLYESLSARSAHEHGPMRRMLDQLMKDPGYARLYEADAPRVARAGSGSHALGLLMVLGAMLDVRGDELVAEGATPIIAIEEPETHLHPILLASTWDVIESLQAQTVVTTNSGELLTSVPMRYLRRLVRRDQHIVVNRLRSGSLSATEHRRVGYHIGAKRGGVLFARCWLLVEGETEFWIMRQLADVLGYDLEAEGVRIVEFAQCGVGPLVKLANDLGIEWHMLTDGDDSGLAYSREAGAALNGSPTRDHISRLKHRDIEHCFWHHGFEQVYREAAGLKGRHDHRGHPLSAGRVIAKAAKQASKPYLAISVAEAAAERGPESVPPILRDVITKSIGLARGAVTDGTERFDS